MQKITPCLWFDTQAEDAANYYCSIFKNSRISSINYYGESGPRPAGTVLLVNFEIEGEAFVALNGGPEFKFNESISFYVDCESQEEIDELWEKLTVDGGAPGQCGWLKDKYGVSWQIVPSVLIELMSDPDPAKANAVTQALLRMRKIDLQGLKDAYAVAG
ncbi:MAG: VOC family protein [Corynebacteriales bacterium]|nr:VOC family protein [Mycobacteriales bacterium]